MKFKITIPAMIGIIVSLAGPVFVEAATSSSARVTMRAEIASRATLSATTTGSAGVTANVITGSSPATLTVTASNDSGTGTEIIPAASVTATSVNGTCSFSPDVRSAPRTNSSPETMGTQQGCSGSYTETFDMYLAKTWKCAAGSQPVTVTYTLTAP